MESIDPASFRAFESTLVPLDSLIATEETDPGRVDDLHEKVVAAGGFLSPIQVVRLHDGRLAILDGHTRREVLRRLGRRLAWIQTHSPSELRLATWLITAPGELETDVTGEMYPVSQETFQRLADTRGGVVSMGGGGERFFTFPNASLEDRLVLQQRVVQSLLAASTNHRLGRREDDIRTGGPGWWRVVRDGDTPVVLLVFPLLDWSDFEEIIRRGLRVAAAASRFQISKGHVDRPMPLDLLALSLQEALPELQQLLAERKTSVEPARPGLDYRRSSFEAGSDPVTPLLSLPSDLMRSLDVPPECRMYIKNEAAIGSSKVRVAYSMLREAFAAGRIGPGTEVVLPSSGSTALAFAEETRKHDMDLTVFAPETIAAGKLAALRAYRHVEVIRVPGSSEVARCAAEEYVAANERARPIFYADQYNDPSAIKAHACTTAPEIVMQTTGSVTHVIAGIGTGATTTGLVSTLSRLGIHVIGVQPAKSNHEIIGLKHLPSLSPHVVPKNARPDLLTAVEYVKDEEALRFTRLLLAHGLRFGPSTGAVLAAACRVAAGLNGSPATLVLIGHDSADYYEGFEGVTQ